MEGTLLKNVTLGTSIATAAQVNAALASLTASVGNAMHFVGVSSVDPKTAEPVVSGVESALVAGDVVLFGSKEYVKDTNGAWVELGDETSYVIKEAGYGLMAEADKTKWDATSAEVDGFGDIVSHNASEFEDAGAAAAAKTALIGTDSDEKTADTIKGAKAAAAEALTEANKKVNAEEGKSLVADTEIAKIHEHANAAELAKIEDGDKAAWDGAVTAIAGFGNVVSHDADEFEAAGAAATVKTEVLGTASDVATANTVYGAKAAAASAQTTADTVTSALKAITDAAADISFTKHDNVTVEQVVDALIAIIAALKATPAA